MRRCVMQAQEKRSTSTFLHKVYCTLGQEIGEITIASNGSDILVQVGLAEAVLV